MHRRSDVKPITYLKNRTADLVREVNEAGRTVTITQNGEAKAVLQDVASYEETQETLALLKLLALGQQDIEAGRVSAVADVVAQIRGKARTG